MKYPPAAYDVLHVGASEFHSVLCKEPLVFVIVSITLERVTTYWPVITTCQLHYSSHNCFQLIYLDNTQEIPFKQMNDHRSNLLNFSS